HRIRLVIIDPLMAFLDGEIDSHKDSDIRRLMFLIRLLAEKTQAAFLVVRHLNKMTTVTEALYRGGGSIGIVGAARSALLVGKPPDDEQQRVLAPIKHNLCAPPQTLAYRINFGDGPARVEWLGVAMTDGNKVLGGLKKSKGEIEAKKVEDAAAKLLATLD